MHSAPLAQPRHSMVVASQTGVAAVQGACVLGAQPRHAPATVQTRGAVQLSGERVQASHVEVVELQIGVVPMHPESSAGSQSTQAPPTHCWAVQSVVSRHSTQAPAVSSQNGVAPVQAAPVPHTHARSTHASVPSASQATPQAVHCEAPTPTHVGVPPTSQQSSFAAHPSWVVESQAGISASGPASSSGPASMPASIAPESGSMRSRSNSVTMLHPAIKRQMAKANGCVRSTASPRGAMPHGARRRAPS